MARRVVFRRVRADRGEERFARSSGWLMGNAGAGKVSAGNRERIETGGERAASLTLRRTGLLRG